MDTQHIHRETLYLVDCLSISWQEIPRVLPDLRLGKHKGIYSNEEKICSTLRSIWHTAAWNIPDWSLVLTLIKCYITFIKQNDLHITWASPPFIQRQFFSTQMKDGRNFSKSVTKSSAVVEEVEGGGWRRRWEKNLIFSCCVNNLWFF